MSYLDETYPYTDVHGSTWIDPDGFIFTEARPCFICKRPTSRVDINYEAFFCNSYACDLQVYVDISKIDIRTEEVQFYATEGASTMEDGSVY